MSKHKRTKMQKMAAVLRVLTQQPHMPTATEIGRLLGYVNGRPVIPILCSLHEQGLIRTFEDTNNFGTTVHYITLTADGKQAAEAIELGLLPEFD